MRVNIGPYIQYIGPYQLADKILFFLKRDKKTMLRHRYVEILAEFLGKLDWLECILSWLYKKRKRKISVKVDNWDIWSADHTLAQVILPVLQALRAGKHGSPFVNDEDVPESIRSTVAPLTAEEEYYGITDKFFHDRWNWVLGEMIFAFEHLASCDVKADQLNDALLERVNNGLRLFAKYYQALWT